MIVRFADAAEHDLEALGDLVAQDNPQHTEFRSGTAHGLPGAG
ncbi:hypothetical protein [Methylobacterium sp. PvR107]|nr:hypothetical protein [Methylobacterium sp. PvR107]MBP1178915.1 hypothetical protein [Methylobacterium sp. PvR107]